MRQAPYGPMTAYCLKTHRGVRGFCATETPKSHSLRPEGIFPACYFGTHYSCRSVADLRYINKVISKWADKARINKYVTFHTSRHTYATMLLTKGADLYTVSKLLGHSEIKTTQIYAEIIDKKKEEAADLLNGIL